jgi:tRNA(Arg) A34 adenosine deaminase TadA
VLSGGCSVLHAEIVTIMAAQKKAGTYDLSSADLPPYELVTSTEPCAMCLGAVTWSGIRRLVCGARGEDAEEVGFDEGEKPAAWPEALERRGIAVLRDVCRERASAVLKDYGTTGGIIYNPHRKPSPG